MLVVKRGHAPRRPFSRKLAANRQTCPASCLVGRWLSRGAAFFLRVCVRKRGARSAVRGRRLMRGMRIRRGRVFPVRLTRRRALRRISAHCRQGRKRKNEDCRPAHEGECGQSRASPVYVDPHSPPSTLADADLSDNWTFPGLLGNRPRFPEPTQHPGRPEALSVWPAASVEIPCAQAQSRPAATPPAATDFPVPKTSPY